MEEFKNQKCYDQDGNFLGWFSRSMAVCAIVVCKDRNGDTRVLVSERGPEAADFQGYWNLVVGYLDFNETTVQAAVREVLEETGIDISGYTPKLVGIQDDPKKSNRQNVTFRYKFVIEDKTCEDFEFSHERNEGLEVGKIEWIKVDELSKYQWAFNHKELIESVFSGTTYTYV